MTTDDYGTWSPGYGENMDALFDIEPEEIKPDLPHYWHDTFPTYTEAAAIDTLPHVFVVVRIAHSPAGFVREAFGLTATRAEGETIIERFRAQMPGSQWDVDEYVPLPF